MSHMQKSPPLGGDFCIKEGGIRTEGSWQHAGGMLQPEAARPQAGNPTEVRQNRIAILTRYFIP